MGAPHVWQTVVVDSGISGENEFWECLCCGAGAGPVWYDANGRIELSKSRLYYTGGVFISGHDCDVAAEQLCMLRIWPGDRHREIAAVQHMLDLLEEVFDDQ